MALEDQIGPLIEPVSGRQLDPRAIRAAVAQRAAALAAAGVDRGTVVLLHYGNCIEFFVDLLALWRLGACAAPVDPRLTAHEVGAVAAVALPRVSLWLAAPPQPVIAALAAHGVRCSVTTDATTLTANRTAAAVAGDGPDPARPAIVLFTSGTTGRPKAVVHTHGALQARWRRKRAALGLERFMRTLCAVPTQYSFGLGVSLFPWLAGATLLLLPPFRQDLLVKLGDLCDQHDVTCVAAVPAVWRIVTRMARPPQAPLQLAASGTAPLPSTLREGLVRWARAPAADIYGLTETGWIAAQTVSPSDAAGADAQLAGTCVGRPLGVEVAILSQPPDDAVLDFDRRSAIGEHGHVYVRSDSLMTGYLGQPDATRAVLRDGWFCTGDLGSVDADGRLWLHGRYKELINVGGTKVYPHDVDALLLSHPAVQDACTFAVDDPLLGEAAAVALVLDDSDADTVASVVDFVRARLAEHQLPRRWYLADRIGRTARGKLDRAGTARACAASRPLDLRALRAPA